MTAALPALPVDIDAGFRRLRLGTMRRLSPELLETAKTSAGAPEELLRTLLDGEIASRDASNARERMRQAAFPVTQTLEELNVASSSVKAATFDFLSSLELRSGATYAFVCVIPDVLRDFVTHVAKGMFTTALRVE